MSNIFVCVRCRPLNSREKARGAVGLIRMSGNQTIIEKPPPGKDEKPSTTKDDNQPKNFAFDRSYWSACSPNEPDYASQDIVFQDIGQAMLNHAFGGYNTCIFAYGQTGSGKSYSMVGYGEEKGIIPLTCMELFERINQNTDINLSYNVEVSYMEIYCERVRDLLNPKGQSSLRVREHPIFGPYVEDLSKMVVKSYADIENLMDEGNKARTVASTNMNATSSRSHAVFTILLTQTRFEPDAQVSTEKVSRVSLVDLAGSERANSTGASGQRLKEGANINKSLTTLGKVISALADQAAASNKKGGKKKEEFVPYRDSVLTWLLKDSLGGNSKTIMLAAISPADYDETLSTLRYADRAKRIVNKAIVNEDPNAKMVRELKEELDLLRSKLAVYDPVEAYANVKDSNGTIRAPPRPGIVTQAHEEIQDQLQASEKLMAELNETWEEKLEKTKSIQVEREKALEELGITIEKNDVGVHSPKRTPHLVNLNEDPFMSECLIYSLKLGITKVGLIDSEVEADIRLSGTNILDNHCHFENINSVVTLHPMPDSMTLVNGRPVTEPKRLRSGYRIILGDCHVFRFTNPEEVRRERTRSRLSVSRNGSEIGEPQSPPQERPESRNSTVASDIVDWSFAWREVALSGSVDLSVSEGGEFSPRCRPFSANGFTESNHLLSSSPERQDLESRLKATQDEMERALVEQRLQYEASFKQFAESRGESEAILPRIFTEREKILIGQVLRCLRKRTFVGMAESVLTNAVILKEANIISRELKKDIAYQFIVIDSLTTSIASSFWESVSAFDELDSSEDTSLVEARVPCVGVQVIDKRNISLCVWSIDKLKQKLSRMRNLYNFMDRPMYREHFNLEDPFYEKPTPQFAMIGMSHISLRNLFWNCSQKFHVPVLNQVNGHIEAQLSVSVSPLAITSTSPIDLPQNQKTNLNIGDQIVFEIIIDELCGLDESRFSQAHVQFRLSSFGNLLPLSAGDKVFATDPVSDFGKEAIRFGYRHSISININETVYDHLMTHPLQLEVFGRPTLKFLQSYDFSEETTSGKEHAHAALIGAPDNIASLRERRHEDELLQQEFHDILAWVYITELAPSGEYAKAPVQATGASDQGCFLLRQGVQRRIHVQMTHNSGRVFPWHTIPKVVLGRVRLVDNKGRYTNENSTATGAVTLNVLPTSIIAEVSNDGTASLQFSAAWDSSLHDSIHLNRNTPNGQRVVMTLNWQVESERLIEPLVFTADLPVSITSRSGSVSKSLFSFMANSTRHLTKISCLYQVTLKPRMTKKRSELWRLNTASTYVRGEEFLRGWKPRGVSLILEARKSMQSRQRRVELELARQAIQLEIIRGIYFLPSQIISEENAQNILKKYVDIWQSLVANKDEIDLASQGNYILQSLDSLDPNKTIGSTSTVTITNGTPPSDNLSVGSDTTTSSLPDVLVSTSIHQSFSTRKTDCDPRKMIGEVRPIARSDNIAKKGFLLVPESAEDWVRRWFVIRRPYMFMYTDNYENEELNAFDLSTVRVDYNKDMEHLLQRDFVFALYTNNNAYMLQAPNLDDMKSWLKCIDQWYNPPI